MVDGREILSLVLTPPARLILAFDPKETMEEGFNPSSYLRELNKKRNRFRYVSPWTLIDYSQPTQLEKTFSASLVKSEDELLEAILTQEEFGNIDVIVNGLGFCDDSTRRRVLRHLTEMRSGQVIDPDTIIVDVGYTPSPESISREINLGASDVLFYEYRSPRTGELNPLTPKRLINRTLDTIERERMPHFAAGLDVLIGAPEDSQNETQLAEQFWGMGTYVTKTHKTDTWVSKAKQARNKGRPYSALIISDDLAHRKKKTPVQALEDVRDQSGLRYLLVDPKNLDAPTIARRSIEVANASIVERPFDALQLRNDVYNQFEVHRIPDPSFKHTVNVIKIGGSLNDKVDEEKSNKFVQRAIEIIKKYHRLGREAALKYDRGESEIPGWSVILTVGGGPRADLTRILSDYTTQDLLDDLRANSRSLQNLIGRLDGRVLEPNDFYSFNEEQALDSLCIFPQLPKRVMTDFVPGSSGRDSDLMPLLLGHIFNPNQNPNSTPGAKTRVIFMKDFPHRGQNGEYTIGRICKYDPLDTVDRGENPTFSSISARDVLDGVISRERLSDDTKEHLIEDSALEVMANGLKIFVNGKFVDGTLNFPGVHFIGPYNPHLHGVLNGKGNDGYHAGSIIYGDLKEAWRNPEFGPYLRTPAQVLKS